MVTAKRASSDDHPVSDPFTFAYRLNRGACMVDPSRLLKLAVMDVGEVAAPSHPHRHSEGAPISPLKPRKKVNASSETCSAPGQFGEYANGKLSIPGTERESMK